MLAELLDAAERGIVRRAEAPVDRPAEPGPTDVRARVGHGARVSYGALLERDGAEFVRHAFVELLGRKPDPGALAHYGEELRSGRLTKAAILGAIRYSSEGRTIGKIVPGLRRRFLLQRSYELPLVGRLLRLAVSVAALPRALRDLQRLEQMAHADRTRLDRLERALAAGPQLGVRVALAEVRLQDLASTGDSTGADGSGRTRRASGLVSRVSRRCSRCGPSRSIRIFSTPPCPSAKTNWRGVSSGRSSWRGRGDSVPSISS